MDTTLRLDLLSKLQEAAYNGAGRSLFEFSAAPAPKTPAPKVIPQPVAPAPRPVEARKPSAPPIPLVLWFTTRTSSRPALFLDGVEPGGRR
jgi:hypothetical protein